MKLIFRKTVIYFGLSIAFSCLALILNFSFKKEDILLSEGKKIEKSLHYKEELIKQYLQNPVLFDSLKQIHLSNVWARRFIPEFRDQRLIYVQTFYRDTVQFYNNIRVYFRKARYIKEGSSFLSTKNGFYEAIKRTQGKFSAVFYIPIKANYPYLNQYLNNEFSPDLIGVNHLDMAGLNDKQVYNIRNSEGKYLFSVKLKSAPADTYYSNFELFSWILAILSGILFFNYFCLWLVRKTNLLAGFITLIFGITAARLMSLKFRMLDKHFDLEIFDPKIYAANFFLPSLGDLLVTVLAISWVLLFYYLHQKELKTHFFRSKIQKTAVGVVLVLFLFLGAYLFIELLFSLINNSNINLDLSNIINLNYYSWMGIFIVCLSTFNLFILIEIVLSLAGRLKLKFKNNEYLIFWGIALLCLVYQVVSGRINLFLIIFPLIAGVQNWFKVNRSKITIEGLVGIALLFALAISVQLSEFKDTKERESRKLLAQRLESPEDPNAVLLFLSKEKRIGRDEMVIDYFQNPLARHQTLVNRLQKLYLDGYLSRYEFEAYEFNAAGEPFDPELGPGLDHFKNMVLSGSVKVSQYFYRNTGSYRFQNYFAIIPIERKNVFLGTLIIELKTKPMDEINIFPQLLMDGKIQLDLGLGNYSYAFYHLNQLADQHGEYIYDLVNKNFKGLPNDFVFKNIEDHTGKLYNHLIYQPNEWKVIVVSKRVSSFIENLASVSFLFILLLIFAGVVVLLNEINTHKQDWKKIFWPINLMYKTRIQLSLLAAVVTTLSITGLITFYNISRQYRSQQEENILEKVKELGIGIKKQFLSNDSLNLDEETDMGIQQFADISHADINLYNIKGDLLLSTQPKFYESGLIAPRMNALAFLYLNKLKVSEYISHEKIGDLAFLASYIPLKNSHSRTVAYLGFPYFSNQQDYEQRIGTFLNALINFYAIILVCIGFVAIFLANQITSPLSLIQKSLSLTKIGRKNKQIKWKRKDEIGNLIREYNNMILALEESAQKLARSERETAWREMAKQVAHEIKNPLTPLKLGVQLLKKSWEEKDPDFNQKFEKFSKSFIDQIESLSHIASEFSNFAKMPDTVLKKTDLKQLLEKSVEVYRHTDKAKINFNYPEKSKIWIMADTDQLLRSFNNLIKNAIEAMPIEQEGYIQIDLYQDEKWAYIEISDNGSGIADNLREQIFVPNFTTKSSGTGLGLAFVKQCLSSIGGTIRFETMSGRGTTFFISIPLIQ